jgi:hypothetical protein
MRFSEQELARMAEWISCLTISGDNEEEESGIYQVELVELRS